MADVVSEPTASSKVEEALVLARLQAAAKVPRHRFGVAYLLLAALLGAAVGLTVVFATGNGSSGGKWSAWKPSHSGVQGRDEIGTFVSHQYALPSGRALVGVLSEPTVVQSGQQPVPVAAIAVRTGLAGETNNDATIIRATGTWAFALCGFAKSPSCAVEGTPTAARYDLLRREALELAAYTFKYNHDIQSVFTYMPPAKAQNAGGAATTSLIFLRRGDLKPMLDSPLVDTLPAPKTTIRPGQMSAKELGVVRRFTDTHIYDYNFQALQDGSAAIVLTPVKA